MMFVMRTMNDNKMKIKVRILNTSTARREGGFIFVLLGLKNGHVYTAVVWWCATIYSLDLYGADHININPPSQIPLGNFSYKFTLKFGHCEKPCSLTKNIVGVRCSLMLKLVGQRLRTSLISSPLSTFTLCGVDYCSSKVGGSFLGGCHEDSQSVYSLIFNKSIQFRPVFF